MSKVEVLSEEARKLLKRYGVCNTCSYAGVREEVGNPRSRLSPKCNHRNEKTDDFYLPMVDKAGCIGHS